MKASYVFLFLLFFYLPFHLVAQTNGMQTIHVHDLQRHMKFLASDELKGRDTGEPGLEVAARYLAVQAEHLGLAPADADRDFMQPFVIEEKAYNREKSFISLACADSFQLQCRDPFYLFPSPGGGETILEGEVVFAGYGIRDEEHAYNDFEDVDIKDKIVLIMNRAPQNEAGTKALFDPDKWSGTQNFQYKLPDLYAQQPRAVLLVMDPKSGMRSIEDMGPGIGRYLSRSRTLKRPGVESADASGPYLALIHRRVADQILQISGKSLDTLQKEIDQNLEPQSFTMDDCNVKLHLSVDQKELQVHNVFGLIEGSDPLLKEEVVIFMAHYDHLGTDDEGGVFNGADDNASGTVALLEIAEAFMKEEKRPARSIGILWVAAEEIGLYGSQYFADHPLVPTEKTAAAINLDMVGRTLMPEDRHSNRRGLTIVGGDTVKVIGALQSKLLMKINEQTMEEMGMIPDYRYNDPGHPQRYFYRSDHISFARKDIPVLFYSTGTHRDYHLVSDVEAAIDYEKFLQMTRLSYRLGYNNASYPNEISVDHPMSSW